MAKSNEEYWQERFIQLLDAQNRKADKSIAEIKKIFQRATRGLQKDIAYWYQRFAAENGLTMAQARQLLKGKELEEFLWTVDEYVQAARAAGDDALALQVANASTRFRVTRLEALQMQLRQRAEEAMGQQTLDGIKDAIRETYSETYYQTAFELQRGTGAVFDVAALDEKQLDLILSCPWMPDGSNFSDRIWKNKAQLIDNLQRELMQGVIKGEAQQKIVDRMAKRMDTAASNVGRLVATESAHFATQAGHDSMQGLGVEEYRILATLDNVTSDICRGMDGQVFKMSEYKPGTTAPPFHPWCRSCTVPNVPRGGLRAARIGDGMTYHVDGKLNYEDWKKEYIKDEKSGFTPEGSKYVNLEYIDSQEYKNKFNAASDNKDLNKAVYERCKAMLTHQSGGYYEDLAILSVDGKRAIGLTSGKKENETYYTDKLKKDIKAFPRGSLISIHNHGTNVPPTGADLVSSGGKGYAFGIVACHDGRVFKYSTLNASPFSVKMFDDTVDKYTKSPYNLSQVDAGIKALERFKKDYGIDWREL